MNYKLSYYTLFTDPVDESGKRILFCSRAGKGLVITGICYEFIQASLFSEIPQETLQKLIDAKAIIDENENELEEIVLQNNEEVETPSTTLYEVIQPSAMCQLGCYYCGQQHEKHNLSASLYNTIIERIETKLKKSTYNAVHIGWFGGEPLVAIKQMRELTVLLKEMCARLNLRYSAKVVSNGLSLTSELYTELTTEMGVEKIEVTLDGTKEFHDIHRYTKKNRGSFDKIFKNLQAIAESNDRVNISIRCNVDDKNWEGVSPLIELLQESGIHKKISYFYPVGIYSWGGNDAHHNSLQKPKFAKQELKWFIEQYQRGFPFGSLVPKRKKTVCMAVSNESEMIDAYGNVFSCTEVSYSPIYKDSNYLQHGKITNPDSVEYEHPLSKWNDEVLEGKYQCQKCRIFPVCGGACPKSWHENIQACPPIKFNLRERLKLNYILNKYDLEKIPQAIEQFSEELESKTLNAIW